MSKQKDLSNIQMRKKENVDNFKELLITGNMQHIRTM